MSESVLLLSASPRRGGAAEPTGGTYGRSAGVRGPAHFYVGALRAGAVDRGEAACAAESNGLRLRKGAALPRLFCRLYAA